MTLSVEELGIRVVLYHVHDCWVSKLSNYLPSYTTKEKLCEHVVTEKFIGWVKANIFALGCPKKFHENKSLPHISYFYLGYFVAALTARPEWKFNLCKYLCIIYIHNYVIKLIPVFLAQAFGPSGLKNWF